MLFRSKREPEQNEERKLSKEEMALLARKLRRQLVSISCLMAVCVLVTVLATRAWFAMNRDVGSSGMQMQVEASANLIIGKTTGDISGVITSLADHISVSFTDPVTVMRPATHDDSATATGLKYNTNPTEVSFSTGVKKSTTELTFADVPVYADGQPRYYVDYTVYLASAGKEMAAKALTAAFDYQTTPETASPDHFNAASVDFYLNNTYKGTRNLVSRDNATTAEAAPLDLLGNSANNESITIPFNQANENNYLTVTMRFYFDGALEKTTGQAYIYSDSLSPATLNLKVSFEAVALDPLPDA